jgi:hypothetical protein
MRFGLSNKIRITLLPSFRLYSNKLTVPHNTSTSLSTIKVANPWKEVKDPNGSNLTYWWNTETQQTTALGQPRPAHWVEVYDQDSKLSYWWNPETNQTTALGAINPNSSNNFILMQPHQQMPTSPGNYLLRLVALGFSLSFSMILVRVMFGF